MIIDYTYKLIRTDRKTIAISINSYNELEVRAPRRYSVNAINELIKSKRSWIEKAMLERQNEDISDILDYKMLLFNGDKLNYSLVNNIDKIILDNKSILLPAKYIDACQDIETLRYQASIKHALRIWYINQSVEYINSVINLLSETIGVSFKKLVINDSRNYFGSCSAKKTVSINWRISMMPDNVKRYLIIHELVHINHMNHSDGFWECVSNIEPDYKCTRKELKSYSYILELFR